MNKGLVIKIMVLIGLSAVSYTSGCYFNRCQREHVVRSESTSSFSEEKRDDSVTKTIPFIDSGSTKSKAFTLADGKKLFKRRIATGSTTFDIEDQYDPMTDSLETRISMVAVKEFVLHFTSTLQKFATQTIRYVEVPDTDDWTWVGVGAAIGGVVVTIIYFVLGLF